MILYSDTLFQPPTSINPSHLPSDPQPPQPLIIPVPHICHLNMPPLAQPVKTRQPPIIHHPILFQQISVTVVY